MGKQGASLLLLVAGLGFEPRQAESEVCLNAAFIGVSDHCTPFNPEKYPYDADGIRQPWS
jgi:hypothetical protein